MRINKISKQDLEKIQGLVFCKKNLKNNKINAIKILTALKTKCERKFMKQILRRSSITKANAPIVRLMNLIWGL